MAKTKKDNKEKSVVDKYMETFQKNLEYLMKLSDEKKCSIASVVDASNSTVSRVTNDVSKLKFKAALNLVEHFKVDPGRMVKEDLSKTFIGHNCHWNNIPLDESAPSYTGIYKVHFPEKLSSRTSNLVLRVGIVVVFKAIMEEKYNVMALVGVRNGSNYDAVFEKLTENDEDNLNKACQYLASYGNASNLFTGEAKILENAFELEVRNAKGEQLQFSFNRYPDDSRVQFDNALGNMQSCVSDGGISFRRVGLTRANIEVDDSEILNALIRTSSSLDVELKNKIRETIKLYTDYNLTTEEKEVLMAYRINNLVVEAYDSSNGYIGGVSKELEALWSEFVEEKKKLR